MKLSLSEIVQLSTVKLTCELQNGGGSTGTGFFFAFKVDEGIAHFIVTNNHVVKDAATISFRLSVLDEEDLPNPEKYEDFQINDTYRNTIPHPDSNVDLCLVNIGNVMARAKESNVEFAFAPMEESTIPIDAPTKFRPIEDIFMVGYPIGLSDDINNLPLVRKGITATPFYVSHNGEPKFLIDCACFPGSSGSPVVILNEGSFSFRDGKLLAGSRFQLVGILSSGPQFGANGKIIEHNIPVSPSVSVYIPMNLGYCIQAEKLLEFKPLIEAIIRQNSPRR